MALKLRSSNQALPSMWEQHHCALPTWTSGEMKMPFCSARETMSDQISKRVVWVVQLGFFARISLVTLLHSQYTLSRILSVQPTLVPLT